MPAPPPPPPQTLSTVSSHAGYSAPRPRDIAGSLRLLAYLAASVALVFADHRGDWLTRIRHHANLLAQPLWQVAGLPAKLGQTMRDDAVTRAQLTRDNTVLRNALLISGARMARLESAAAENARLRAMLGVVQQGRMDVQLAPILNIDLDPTRQRLVLDAGSRQGVRPGQAVIDAGGLLGQVIEVQPGTATVLLLTDPDHAVPVEVARNGVRLVAYGHGDHISLGHIPRTADVRVGDVVQTSGIGGRFPPGFPVGSIEKLRPDDSRAFLVGDLKPAAALDRGREVLLLREVRGRLDPPPAANSVPIATGRRVTAGAADAATGTDAPSSPVAGAPTTAMPARNAAADARPADAPPTRPAR
ncbi:rod shape-determining protein MreC [Lysobacter pythonis]|uniref:Cell shape-determining protein MreC n=1 Tax=Solilutibacter pythonis TaxID=2483112 RepID=A0A3M2HNT0_9GAMM|nr:rod shape-determining protein MreC [Lysobacter pythonis]RMH87907.1 rod shape-determining protein MreC [Lysobacter pythonis]